MNTICDDCHGTDLAEMACRQGACAHGSISKVPCPTCDRCSMNWVMAARAETDRPSYKEIPAVRVILKEQELDKLAADFCNKWAGGDVMAGDMSYYTATTELRDLLKRVYEDGQKAA
jgi:hypothetical protein